MNGYWMIQSIIPTDYIRSTIQTANDQYVIAERVLLEVMEQLQRSGVNVIRNQNGLLVIATPQEMIEYKSKQPINQEQLLLAIWQKLNE